MGKLSTDVRSWLRDFAFCLANGSLDSDRDDDYRALLQEPSFVEQAFALWSNVLDVDDCGKVLNGEQAQKRVEQYIRTWLDKSFNPQPAFSDWEMELH